MRIQWKQVRAGRGTKMEYREITRNKTSIERNGIQNNGNESKQEQNSTGTKSRINEEYKGKKQA